MGGIEKHIRGWHKHYPLNQNNKNNPQSKRKTLTLPHCLPLSPGQGNALARESKSCHLSQPKSWPPFLLNQQFYFDIQVETTSPRVQLNSTWNRGSWVTGWWIYQVRTGQQFHSQLCVWVLGRGWSAAFHGHFHRNHTSITVRNSRSSQQMYPDKVSYIGPLPHFG